MAAPSTHLDAAAPLVSGDCGSSLICNGLGALASLSTRPDIAAREALEVPNLASQQHIPRFPKRLYMESEVLILVISALKIGANS
ncbi:Thaumatin family protein [Corchorus olitorius]|uniref:Thaumatin family protein n=1 Tax=Corchorus olitorius TaxID=93759 RepID=A0A1R3HF86_9ROSI|nr:Thaumatin family protein [Corchorus olitorius]